VLTALSLSYPLNANETQGILRLKSRDSFQEIEEDVSPDIVS